MRGLDGGDVGVDEDGRDVAFAEGFDGLGSCVLALNFVGQDKRVGWMSGKDRYRNLEVRRIPGCEKVRPNARGRHDTAAQTKSSHARTTTSYGLEDASTQKQLTTTSLLPLPSTPDLASHHTPESIQIKAQDIPE